MNTPAYKSSPHPLMIVAAIAVVLFCLAGTAAIMGWIPSSIGGNTSNGDLTEADRLALASQLQEQKNERPKTVAKPVQVAAATPAPAKNRCTNCGNIESIREITKRAEGSGLGAAGGAVLGGLLGNQIGGGTGRQLATVAGAVGGAVVGNQVEGNMKASKSYEIRVRLDDGSTRTFNQQSAPSWGSGDRVRVVNGALRSIS